MDVAVWKQLFAVLDLKIVAYERVERDWENGAEMMNVAFASLIVCWSGKMKIIGITAVATPGPDKM